MSHDDRQPAPTNAQPQSQQGSALVDTEWMVDYDQVAGKTRDLPQRKATQLVVDELKVMADAGGGKILKGGNVAMSGPVSLGKVSVPRGPGHVSAAVRYAPRTSFKVSVQVLKDDGHPAQLDKAERESVRIIQDDIANELGFRGDYAQLAVDMTERYRAKFDKKTLKIAIATGAKGDSLAAATSKYDAPTDSKFSVKVVPRTNLTHSSTRDIEHKNGNNHTDGGTTGIKTTNDVEREKNSTLATTTQTQFAKKLSENVKLAFENLWQHVDHKLDQTETVSGTDVTWKVGIEPPKEAKPSAPTPASTNKDDGVVKSVARSVEKYLFDTGKAALGKLPIVGTALELGGDLWDVLKVRGSVERTSLGNDHTTKTTGNPEDTTTSIKTMGAEEVAREMTTTLMQQIQTTVNQKIASHFGVEVSSSSSSSDGHTDDTRVSEHVEVIEHEVGDLGLQVEPDGK